ARMGPCDPDRFALEADAEDLLAKHEKRWREGLPKTGAQIEFARGFPHRFTMPLPKFFASGEGLLDAAPTLTEYAPRQTAAHWDGLMASPPLDRLTALDTGRTLLGAGRLAALANSPRAAGLRWLDLSRATRHGAGLDALFGSPHLAGLRHLA